MKSFLRLESLPTSAIRGDSSLPPPLQGFLDFIGPTMVTGWALHRQQPIAEVRFSVGEHLLATARCAIDRPDVAAVVGGEGRVGFALAIDEQLPLVVFAGLPAVRALAGDGNVLGEICFHNDGPLTQRMLSAALDPNLRGMAGHCDGVAGPGGPLQGWAHRGRRGPCVVWLQGLGPEAQPIPCAHLRPDIQCQGQPLACGFQIPWSAAPEAAAALRVTFDQKGLLPLPGLG